MLKGDPDSATSPSKYEGDDEPEQQQGEEPSGQGDQGEVGQRGQPRPSRQRPLPDVALAAAEARKDVSTDSEAPPPSPTKTRRKPVRKKKKQHSNSNSAKAGQDPGQTSSAKNDQRELPAVEITDHNPVISKQEQDVAARVLSSTTLTLAPPPGLSKSQSSPMLKGQGQGQAPGGSGNPPLINKDIQTFLHRSRTSFDVEDVKHAMDNARIIGRSEDETEAAAKKANARASARGGVSAKSKAIIMKWRALALKAKAQRGVLDNLEEEEDDQVQNLIKRPTDQEAKSAMAAVASLSKNKNKAGATAPPPPPGPTLAASASTSALSSKAALKQQRTNDSAGYQPATTNQNQGPDESSRRLALIRDARRVNPAATSGLGAAASGSQSPRKAKGSGREESSALDDDIGMRRNKKTKKMENAMPLIPRHLKKGLVPNLKVYMDADKEFYKAFILAFVDIPEPEEDCPSECPSTLTSKPLPTISAIQ